MDWKEYTSGGHKAYKINVMAIKKNGHMNLAISADDIFTSDETLLVIGEHKAIQKCFHI